MATLNETLMNETELEAENKDFSPLPAGEYDACLVEIGDKENPSNAFTIANNGKGEYLRTVFEVVKGQYKGRKLFENLQLKRYTNTEKDQTTIKIARGKLSRMCIAYGIQGSLQDTNQLLNKPPVLITVKVTKGFGDYGPGNEITKWESLIPSQPPAAQQAQQPQIQPDPFSAGIQAGGQSGSGAQQPPWGQ